MKELEMSWSVSQTQTRVRVEIGGHTDNVGQDKDNLVLSQQRAETIRNWVIRRELTPPGSRQKVMELLNRLPIMAAKRAGNSTAGQKCDSLTHSQSWIVSVPSVLNCILFTFPALL